jgi:hypothetical protein
MIAYLIYFSYDCIQGDEEYKSKNTLGIIHKET